MKIIYDPDHDIMNIEFLENEKIADTTEYDEGILIDYSSDGKIVSIEIIDASTRIKQEPIDMINIAIVDNKKKIIVDG